MNLSVKEEVVLDVICVLKRRCFTLLCKYINVQALPSGVYVIRISDGVGQTNRKFIKN